VFTFTYEIFGHSAVYIGEGDRHQKSFDGDEGLKHEYEFAAWAAGELSDGERRFCHFSALVYPSEQWRDEFFTNDPYAYAGGVIACFAVTTLVFVIYDFLVQQRQAKVMHSAKRTHAIVNSLFPENVRDRLMNEVQNDNQKDQKTSFLNNGKIQGKDMSSEAIFGSKPIADL
jgi:hypothetical protein